MQLRDPKNPHIEIQRYIEESKFKLGKDYPSKFLRQAQINGHLPDPIKQVGLLIIEKNPANET
jgi:hypothetical protein